MSSSTPEQQGKQQEQFRLNLFQTLDEKHGTHGILHQDYEQYHKYCTAKLYRIRHIREVKTSLVHNAKYVEGMSSKQKSGRKKHAYCPRDAVPGIKKTTDQPTAAEGGGGDDKERLGGDDKTKNVEDPSATSKAPAIIHHENILWNLFYQSERAWAQACASQSSNATTSTTSSSRLSNTNKKKKSPSSHAFALRRLQKAKKWAELLHETSQRGGCCTQETQLEIQSYTAWMRANVALEQKRYKDAFFHYKESMNVLLRLASDVGKNGSSTSSSSSSSTGAESVVVGREALALCDLYTNRAENLLRPLVRFCGYEAREQIDAKEIEEMNAGSSGSSSSSSTRKKKTDGSTTAEGAIVLTFRGKDIALDPYKQLAVLYLKIERPLNSSTSLSASSSPASVVGNSNGGGGGGDNNNPDNGDETQFLQLLSDLDDALRMVQTERSHYDSLPSGPAVTAKRFELDSLRKYFQYHKLSLWRNQQERRILKDVSDMDDSEIVHVYDTLQQNVESMAELLSAPSTVATGDDGDDDGGADVDDLDINDLEDDPLWLQAQAHILRIRAFRCYYLARLYESTLNGTTKQILALLSQSNKLAKRAQEEIAACMDDDDNTDNDSEAGAGGTSNYLDSLDELQKKIEVMTCRIEAAKFVRQKRLSSTANGDSTVIPAFQRTSRPLWMRLNDCDAGVGNIELGESLADNPPLPIPMPCKPAFYDLAWQYVDTEIPTDKIQEYITANEPKKKSKGLFASLFGS